MEEIKEKKLPKMAATVTGIITGAVAGVATFIMASKDKIGGLPDKIVNNYETALNNFCDEKLADIQQKFYYQTDLTGSRGIDEFGSAMREAGNADGISYYNDVLAQSFQVIGDSATNTFQSYQAEVLTQAVGTGVISGIVATALVLSVPVAEMIKNKYTQKRLEKELGKQKETTMDL